MTVEISDTGEGEGIIAWSWRSTLVLTAALALGVSDPDSLGLIGVGVAVVMFAMGTVLFLWSYAIAVAAQQGQMTFLLQVSTCSAREPRNASSARCSGRLALRLSSSSPLLRHGLSPFLRSAYWRRCSEWA